MHKNSIGQFNVKSILEFGYVDQLTIFEPLCVRFGAKVIPKKYCVFFVELEKWSSLLTKLYPLVILDTQAYPENSLGKA